MITEFPYLLAVIIILKVKNKKNNTNERCFEAKSTLFGDFDKCTQVI